LVVVTEYLQHHVTPEHVKAVWHWANQNTYTTDRCSAICLVYWDVDLPFLDPQGVFRRT